MGPSFFGLGSDSKEYILEEIFQAVRYGKVTLTEVWNMPVEIRRWWLDKTVKALNAEKGGGEEHTDPFGGKN